MHLCIFSFLILQILLFYTCFIMYVSFYGEYILNKFCIYDYICYANYIHWIIYEVFRKYRLVRGEGVRDFINLHY